ncbi:hypothetical protein B0S90_2346 [Caldicellulosiruptor bescii]|uniref:Uncharacterized protein n=2 Tax=Caldicellulosiruptor bescii TaxID=31899 RepID=B9MLB1_CALBD|nr:conserved hypothetical protein [Caldicellulosiruptor bescii DSM 6725]PBC89085.1 hypothetical protein B0S87_2144 [Caldicellulosiruptor bescii]PBC91433.1 hypothetical protein B0S89_1848 [Caldicellulosiruptor bescii]PBD03156.1 hypothetical protein B0S85_0721 [Caldicellulosiruptor bescii]PBD07231.1 hypothetical protein B0S90_2346 [Caldicellulosiruptor bescii]
MLKKVVSVAWELLDYWRRYDGESFKSLKKLSEQLNQPMQKIIQEALEEYKKKVILSATAEAFIVLKGNSKLWQEEIEERQLWENTLGDGIEK